MFLVPLKGQFGRHFFSLFLNEQHLGSIKGRATKGRLQNPAANSESVVGILHSLGCSECLRLWSREALLCP